MGRKLNAARWDEYKCGELVLDCPANLESSPRARIIMSTLTAAILVVSTTASKDNSSDSCGPILKNVFEQEGGGKWEVIETKIVGDDIPDIQRCITAWAEQHNPPNVIITTGGTGFAIHDVTPEVCEFSSWNFRAIAYLV